MEKPKCKLIGEDGNIYVLSGIASKALRKSGQADKVSEMQTKIMTSGSYNEALQIIMKYVDVE